MARPGDDAPSSRTFLRLPVVSLVAEHLVMGYLMRRNILGYKAPPGNEGYDLIGIHPTRATSPARIRRLRSECR